MIKRRESRSMPPPLLIPLSLFIFQSRSFICHMDSLSSTPRYIRKIIQPKTKKKNYFGIQNFLFR